MAILRKLRPEERKFIHETIKNQKLLERKPTSDDEKDLFASYLVSMLGLTSENGEELQLVKFPQFVDKVRQHIKRHGKKDKKQEQKEKEAEKKVDAVARYKKRNV